MGGTDQDCVAHGISDEKDAAKQERAQEHVPKHGIGLHDMPQVRSVDLEQFARFACTA
jgi:hypothetical protein